MYQNKKVSLDRYMDMLVQILKDVGTILKNVGTNIERYLVQILKDVNACIEIFWINIKKMLVQILKKCWYKYWKILVKLLKDVCTQIFKDINACIERFLNKYWKCW